MRASEADDEWASEAKLEACLDYLSSKKRRREL
jgi:hypothetical protein